jgi:DNA-binding response OmpR family regulator
MNERTRILIVGREQEYTDQIIGILERVGCIVTGTLDDGVAIDLAGSSDYDVLLISDEVRLSDGRYVATEARRNKPWITVVMVQSPESVLTQLRQAGVRL